MIQGSDVIIVGGGIMGTSTAFFLALRGRKVVLLEQGLVGQYASGTNFGNLRGTGRVVGQLPLWARARAIWRRLPELIGEDCEVLETGRVELGCRDEDLAYFADYARAVRDHDLDIELLDAGQVRRRLPYLADHIIGGMLAPYDGQANPRLASPAFARAALRSGARIREGVEVVDIGKSGTDFRVETANNGTFHAPIVLIAAGAWADRLSAAFGEPVPLQVRGPQMAVTEPTNHFIEPSIGIRGRVPGDFVYFRQIERGNIIIGGGERTPVDLVNRRAHVRPQGTLTQIRQLSEHLPLLRRLNLIRVWSGIESYLPDDLPVIGPSGTTTGLYYAFGFCGYGFQLGPGVGEALAELIVTGKTDTPIADYHIARFAGGGLAQPV